MTWIIFGLGVFAGANIGIFVLGLLHADDHRNEAVEVECPKCGEKVIVNLDGE